MAKTGLTGIERKLVLDYLALGESSLSFSPAEEKIPPAEKRHGGRPAVFPVVLRGGQFKILEQGIIVIQDSVGSISSFDGEMVRVQFYYNKLSLCFEAKMQRSSAGLALVVPDVISRVEDKISKPKDGFSIIIFYETAAKNAHGTDIVCDFSERFPLFVPADYQKRIETYLSEPVHGAEESIADRIHAPEVIYVDSERIVFASKKSDMPLSVGAEYAVLLRFPIAGPLKERKVYLSCRIDNMFESYECDRLCAVALFSSIREEDVRFLSDKNGSA